jgi:4-amino-4-deoxy-L-arabinose transferase-like glycosyltransferase
MKSTQKFIRNSKKDFKFDSILPAGFTESTAAFWILIFFALILIFNDLSTPGLVSFDDCYYAQKGWEMLKGNDWITPHYGGKLDFINPPLFFWMIAAGFAAFGKTAFAVKFFTALCGFGTVLVTYETGKTIKDRTIGWWSAFFLSTSYIFLKSSRRAMMDVPFLFFAALALLFFVRASKLIFDLHPDMIPAGSKKAVGKNPKPDINKSAICKIWIYFILFGFFAGLAALIKTVLAVFVIGIPFIFAHFYRRKYLKHLLPMIFSILTAAITSAWWFVYELVKYGNTFFDGFYNKMLSGHIHGVEKMESGALGYLFEFGRHFWLWLPLTLWAFYIIIRKKRLKNNKFLQLMIMEALLPVFVLSFAGNKTIRYVLFTFAPMIILTAIIFINEFSREKLHRLGIIAVLFLTLLSVYLVARPVDMKKINNKDYIELAGLIQSGDLPLQGEKFYHYRGEFWINQNPLFYYCNIRLAGIISDRVELNRRLSSGEPFYLLAKKDDRSEIPLDRLILMAELRDRILFMYK